MGKKHQKEIEKEEKHHQKEIEKEEKQHQKDIEKEHKLAVKEEKKHQKEIEKEEKHHQKELTAAETEHHKQLEKEEKARREAEGAAAAAAGTGAAAYGVHEHDKRRTSNSCLASMSKNLLQQLVLLGEVRPAKAVLLSYPMRLVTTSCIRTLHRRRSLASSSVSSSDARTRILAKTKITAPTRRTIPIMAGMPLKQAQSVLVLELQVQRQPTMAAMNQAQLQAQIITRANMKSKPVVFRSHPTTHSRRAITVLRLLPPHMAPTPISEQVLVPTSTKALMRLDLPEHQLACVSLLHMPKQEPGLMRQDLPKQQLQLRVRLTPRTLAELEDIKATDTAKEVLSTVSASS